MRRELELDLRGKETRRPEVANGSVWLAKKHVGSD